ncbi:hypothetical protein [Nostoc sp. 'Lobaria pulmonaria (5183) cyanobiont']|uniref:hypothetical protein n=1 Tax=Nostoc sp. 'Lobaria pulmonaria (5183) cyanobiont' TaxID=1618022 RepID=UPI00131A2A43|nr:hypothetical protein [Nostoc sp. 'Lobaria pulmonaria (5183) cyanobiont']
MSKTADDALLAAFPNTVTASLPPLAKARMNWPYFLRLRQKVARLETSSATAPVA